MKTDLTRRANASNIRGGAPSATKVNIPERPLYENLKCTINNCGMVACVLPRYRSQPIQDAGKAPPTSSGTWTTLIRYVRGG
ncbi:hypothetical protein V5799_005155 [Amblyomma americanum]|uniref:Uncharacterized protein n=1 Tax=Amblyomma americanum TaxID=6943 RepID=A0AAQ4E025_AMBAM